MGQPEFVVVKFFLCSRDLKEEGEGNKGTFLSAPGPFSELEHPIPMQAG